MSFHPTGKLVLTGSQDTSCRLWSTDTGECVQLLQSHSDEIFSCEFNYDGDTIISASKDNSCCVWRTLRRDWERLVGYPYKKVKVKNWNSWDAECPSKISRNIRCGCDIRVVPTYLNRYLKLEHQIYLLCIPTQIDNLHFHVLKVKLFRLFTKICKVGHINILRRL